MRHLQDQAFLPVQTCQSTYGVFGYYVQNDVDRAVYLKPRVNLRDVESEHNRHLVHQEKAECGQPYPCQHVPDGGNHPVAQA